MPALHPPSAIPTHVAIIMDGNGRWAEAFGRSRIEGHAEGARAVRHTVRASRQSGVRYLTLYAFSIANWGRPADEVQALMALLIDFAEKEKVELRDQGVRVQVVGNLDELPPRTRQAVQRTMDFTADCTQMTLSLALSYGGRADLANAARQLAAAAVAGKIRPEDIDEDSLHQKLSTATLPPVDLLIRTGGEQRMSDFLLFESAYAELYFLQTMWPEFGPPHLADAIAYFASRQRRFGLTGHQVTQPASQRPSNDEAPLSDRPRSSLRLPLASQS